MIDLQGPHPDERRPARALHHPTARRHGQRKLRRWTAIGALGVTGLTAATAGLAYRASAGEDAARNAQKQRVLAQYQRRQAIQSANLATLRAEQHKLARTLARERALVIARRRARQQQIIAIQVAQAAAAAQAARAPVFASVRGTPAPTRAAAPVPRSSNIPPRSRAADREGPPGEPAGRMRRPPHIAAAGTGSAHRSRLT